MGKVVKVDDTHIHTCTTETRQNVFLLTFTATNRLRCSKLKKTDFKTIQTHKRHRYCNCTTNHAVC